MKVVPMKEHRIEWMADVTCWDSTRTIVVCTDARALLDFVTKHIGPLDDSSRRCAAIWLEIQNQKGHVLTVRSRRSSIAKAKLRAIYRLEVA